MAAGWRNNPLLELIVGAGAAVDRKFSSIVNQIFSSRDYFARQEGGLSHLSPLDLRIQFHASLSNLHRRFSGGVFLSAGEMRFGRLMTIK
jgi:hypothetical protein